MNAMREQKAKREWRHSERGVAIVEFVIMVPILLMLLIAVGELGRAFWQYNMLTKSVEDGARYVAGRALQGTTGVVSVTPTLQAAARNLVVYGNVVGAGGALLPGLTTGQVTVANAGMGNITVSAAYPYAPIFGFIPGFFYGPNQSVVGVQLQTAVSMRAL
jgi:Flp pilus assembly protein TadG